MIVGICGGEARSCCFADSAKYVPKWKKQACEVPSSQNEHSHYRCDDNGEVKCLNGWTGDLCDVPICRKGCDPLQGYCKRPGECRCKLGIIMKTSEKRKRKYIIIQVRLADD
uniref:DSL domain-containing protein n=1 Tax=Rhodnius prolixus TaxID=13249 RepID=T1HC44_RHOPR